MYNFIYYSRMALGMVLSFNHYWVSSMKYLSIKRFRLTSTQSIRLMSFILSGIVMFLLPLFVVDSYSQDSVIVIPNFKQEYSFKYKRQFISSFSGDTVAILYPTVLSRSPQRVLDTLELRVRLWNGKTGKPIKLTTFRHIQSSFSSELYTLQILNGAIHVFHVPFAEQLSISNSYTGDLFRSISFDKPIERITYSPDTKFSCVNTAQSFNLVNNSTGETILKEQVRVLGGRSVAFRANTRDWSWDSKIVMISRYELWDIYALGTYKPFDINSRRYLSVEFDRKNLFGEWNPNAKMILSQPNGRIRCIGLDSSVTIIPTTNSINSVAWAKNSNNIVAVDVYFNVVIFNFQQLSKVSEFYPGVMRSYSFSPQGNYLAYIVGDQLTIIDNTNGNGLHQIQLPTPVSSKFDFETIRWIEGEKAVIIKDINNALNVVNLTSRSVVTSIDSNDLYYPSANGLNLFVAKDTSVERYDIIDGKKTLVFPNAEISGDLVSYSLSPDGAYAVTLDNVISVWRVSNGELMNKRRINEAVSVHCSPDSSYLYVQLREQFSLKNSILVLKLPSLDTAFFLSGTNDVVFRGFSPNGKYVLTSQGRTADVRKVGSQSIVQSKSLIGSIRAVTMSSDAVSWAIADDAGNTNIYNFPTGNQLHNITGINNVRNLLLSGNGSIIVIETTNGLTCLNWQKNRAIGNLYTKPLSYMLTGNATMDSLLLVTYEDAIIEFDLKESDPTQTKTATTPILTQGGRFYFLSNDDDKGAIYLYKYRGEGLNRTLKGYTIDNTKGMQWSKNNSICSFVSKSNDLVLWRMSNINVRETIVSVDELSNQHDVDSAVPLIYPNPVQTSFTIASTKPIQSLSLIDMLGNSAPIDISSNGSVVLDNYPNGMYMLSITFEDGTIHQAKVVVRN